MGYTQTRVQKYGDGRWGFDDYSSGKRVMVRLWSKEKAEKRAENIALQLTDSRGDLLPIVMNELSEFREWKANQKRATTQ